MEYKGNLKWHVETVHEKCLKEKYESHLEYIRDESLFSCEKCGKKFEYKRNLKLHIITVHEKCLYKCIQCNFRTTKSDHLRKHVKLYHKGMNERTYFYCAHNFEIKEKLNNQIKLKAKNWKTRKKRLKKYFV